MAQVSLRCPCSMLYSVSGIAEIVCNGTGMGKVKYLYSNMNNEDDDKCRSGVCVRVCVEG